VFDEWDTTYWDSFGEWSVFYEFDTLLVKAKEYLEEIPYYKRVRDRIAKKKIFRMGKANGEGE